MSKLEGYGFRVGEILSSNKCGKYKVMQIVNTSEITIQFLSTGTIRKVAANNMRKGSVSDKMYPTIFGVGCIGYGKYVSRVSEKAPKTQAYQSWENMLARCYYKKASRYSAYGGIGVTVCEDWLNFQVFAEWHKDNYIEVFHLDSDILTQHNKCKTYSPETSVYIPQSLNGLFVNKYKNSVKASGLPEGVSPCKSSKYNYQASVSVRGIVSNSKGFITLKEACDYYDKEKTKLVRVEAERYYREGKISEKIYLVLKDYTFKRKEEV